MQRTPDARFEDYDIFAIAVPRADGKWEATSEIEKAGAQGLEVFPGVGGPCLAETEEAARAAACNDAKRKYTLYTF